MKSRTKIFDHTIRVVVVSVSFAILMPAVSAAQQQAGGAAPAAGDNAELAKQLSNPVADLVSVPFQLNWEQGVGPDDQTRLVLNVQPVMPFSVNPNWNMIAASSCRSSVSRRWPRGVSLRLASATC